MMKHLKKTMCVFLSFVLTFSSVQVVPSHAVAVDELSGAPTEPLTVEQPAPTQPAGGTPATRSSEEPAATSDTTPAATSDKAPAATPESSRATPRVAQVAACW